jgi:protein SCO1/2
MKLLKLRRAIPILAAVVALTSLPAMSGAQEHSTAQHKSKAYTLHGKIEAVKAKEKSLTVNHKAMPGFMGAMTMDYKVANPEVLKTLKVGDQIVAIVYDDGTYALHNIKVVPPKK